VNQIHLAQDKNYWRLLVALLYGLLYYAASVADYIGSNWNGFRRQQ
jgi:hypothetical protein